MPFGMREIMLAIEARDNASATINAVGSATGNLAGQSRFAGYQIFAMGLALQKAGTALENFGKRIFSIAGQVYDLGSSFDYNMRLVQTQARLGETQLRHFEDAANDVMATVPSSAEEVSQGLYDIFSSVETNYKDALDMITSFSRAAVAGDTDVRSVTRGVIQIMNAFGLQAKDTGNILNLLFKQVQQSTGTFEELITAWGNVVSAAKAMDQTLQTTAGAVDFLTKRGRTQAQATISVSRALDQLSRHYKDVQDVLGVRVFDEATGNFRQLNAIITDMGKAMSGMTTEEQTQAFTDMFGAGSIQANRFFRLAIPQFQELNHNIDVLQKKDIKGYFKDAWDIMRKTPAVQIAILQNKWESLQRDLREMFIPVLLDIVKIGKRVLDWFRDLSPEAKELAAKIILAVGAFAVFFGAIARVGGGLLLFASLLKFAGLGVAGFLKTFGLVGGWAAIFVAALVGAAYLIITHWEEFTAWWDRNWETIKHILIAAVAILTAVLVNFAREAVLNVGASLINLVVSFQAAGGAAGVFGATMKTLGVTLSSIGWVALAFGVLEFANALREGRDAGHRFFDMLQKRGGDVVSGAIRRINRLNDRLASLSFWSRLAFWRWPEYARWKGEIQGLEDDLDRLARQQDRHRQKLYDWADGIANGDDQLRTFAQTLIWNTDLNKKQVEGFVNALAVIDQYGKGVDEVTLKNLANLAVMGDTEAMQGIIDRLIKGKVIPGLKDYREAYQKLAGPMSRHNEFLKDQANRANQAASNERELSRALIGNWGALKNLLTPEERHNENLADMGQKAAYAAAKQRELNRALNGGLGALKNLPSYAQAYAEKMADLGQKLAAAAGAQRAFNQAAAGAGTGGTGGRGGGTSGGTSGGTGGGNPTGGGQRGPNVTVNVTSRMTEKELARELNWVVRTM